MFTVLPHFVWRYRQMCPEVARDVLLATHGGLSLAWCAVIYHISPMALYRLMCALGSQSLVAVLTRCGLPLPTYFLADEKHSHCLTDRVYLPTIVRGRVIWHLGYTERQCGGLYPIVRGVSSRGLPAGPSLSSPGHPDGWLRQHHQEHAHALPVSAPRQLPPPRAHQAPWETDGHCVPVRQALRSQFHTLLYRVRQRTSLRVFALGQR